MIYISICATLLTMLAAMHLLAKTNKEALGSLFKWVSYLVLLVASLILLCQVVQGVCKMCCKDSCKKERCEMKHEKGHHKMMMMMHSQGGCCDMHKMHDKACCSGMKCEDEKESCEGKEKSGCGEHAEQHDSTHVHAGH